MRGVECHGIVIVTTSTDTSPTVIEPTAPSHCFTDHVTVLGAEQSPSNHAVMSNVTMRGHRFRDLLMQLEKNTCRARPPTSHDDTNGAPLHR